MGPFTALGALVLTFTVMPVVARQPIRPADPVEPIGAIVDALRKHPIVALGDVHGSEQSHALRVALLHDKRFTDLANDIVVEFGNARFQALMDRFNAGGDVADEDLRHVWQDTTQISGVWDRPVYGDFFRAVREVNRHLDPDRKLHVLLGDPPVDWDLVRRINEGPASEREGKVRINGIWMDKAEASAFDRDAFAARIIEHQVLAKGRRALLVCGDMHVLRNGRSVVSRLERSTGTEVFSIVNAVGTRYDALMRARPDVGSWPAPALALLDDGPAAAPDRQSDAVLYLGPPTAMTSSKLSTSLCSDVAYLKMRRERMAWAGVPDGRAEELLAQDCGRSR